MYTSLPKLRLCLECAVDKLVVECPDSESCLGLEAWVRKGESRRLEIPLCAKGHSYSLKTVVSMYHDALQGNPNSTVC